MCAWGSSSAVCVPCQPGLNFCARQPSVSWPIRTAFCPAWLCVAPRLSVTAPPLGLDVPTECSVCSSMSRFSSVTVMICEVVHCLLTVGGHQRFQFGHAVWSADSPVFWFTAILYVLPRRRLLLSGQNDILIFSILWILDAFPKEFCFFFFFLCGINSQWAHKCCCTDVSEWNLDYCCWAWTNTPKTKPLFHVWCILIAYWQVKNCIDLWKFVY